MWVKNQKKRTALFAAASRRFAFGRATVDMPHESVTDFLERGGTIRTCPTAGTQELRDEMDRRRAER